MTTIELPDALPTLVPVTFDLYRDIHKAIRAEMFGVVLAAGQADPGDAGATADLAAQVTHLADFLDLHALHEDRHIQPLLLEVTPQVAERIEVDHGDFEADCRAFVLRAAEIDQVPAAQRRQLLHALYVDLAAFASRYLAHQDLEERVVMPALEAAVGVEAVLGVHGQIIGTMPPEELMSSLAVMFPAMNADDRTDLLGGMRATAPAEAFEGVWGLVGYVLCPEDVAQLATRLALP